MIFLVEERAPLPPTGLDLTLSEPMPVLSTAWLSDVLPVRWLNQIVCPSATWKAGRQHVIDAGVIRELQEPRTKIHRDAAHVDDPE